MGRGDCLPRPGEQFLTDEMYRGNGAVHILVRWSWDNVSVYPACDGPIQDVFVENTGVETWRCLLPNKKRGNPWVDIPAGFSDTITGNRLNQAGLTTRSDVLGIELVQV
jgi:hypothetical protein